MSLSSAQVMTNITHVAYILKVSQIIRQQYEYSYFEPLIKYGKWVAPTYHFLLHNETQFFSSDQPCKPRDNHFVCEATQISHTPEFIHRLSTEFIHWAGRSFCQILKPLFKLGYGDRDRSTWRPRHNISDRNKCVNHLMAYRARDFQLLVENN